MSRPHPPLTSSAERREYGSGGLFGLLTPGGNPTAEPELRILLPPDTSLLVARLTSAEAGLRQRLAEYDARLDEFIDSFGAISLDALGVACTGLSYGCSAEEEADRLRRLASRKGYPVITAAQAVRSAAESLGLRSLALVSPYPPWLTSLCRRYWERGGWTITAVLQLPSGSAPDHRIYELSSQSVIDALAGVDTAGAEGLLLAGTGMPSLRAIVEIERAREIPVLSSNLCLAWALMRTTAAAVPGVESRLYGGWAHRLASA